MSATDYIEEITAQRIVDLLKKKHTKYNLELTGYTLKDGVDLAIDLIEKEYNLKETNG